MSDDSMRAKARATFGKEFMAAAAPQGYAKNGAVALQQRANARPIPTYKVGGQVKKPVDPYGGDRTPSTKIPAPRPSVEGPDIKAGQMKPRTAPGADKKLKAAQDRASALGLKEGGKAGKGKPGLAIMIAVGKTKPVKRADGGLLSALGIGKKKPDNLEALKSALKSSGESGMRDIQKDIGMSARESIGTNTAARAQSEIPEGGKRGFGAEFKAARERGDKTFSWNGKNYTTAMAGERKAAPQLPTRKAIKVAAPAAKAAIPKAESVTVAPRAGKPAVKVEVPVAKVAKAVAPAVKKSPEELAREGRKTRGLDFLTSSLGMGTSKSRAEAKAEADRRVAAEQSRRANVSASKEKAKAGRLAAMKAAAEAPGASKMTKRSYESAMKTGMYADGGKVIPERIMARAASGMMNGGTPRDAAASKVAMKKGGKVHTSSDTARKLATEMGGMKCGGKPGKYAAGGAGKTRKGQAPIKLAKGGAGKVRKGMMSQSGDIMQAVRPKKGIGGIM